MNGDPALDAKHLRWLHEQMTIGYDMSETVAKLRKVGFSDAAIVNAFEAVRPLGNALTAGVHSPPLIRRAPPNLHKVDSPKVDLYLLEDFLSAKECARLVALIGHHLRPSTLSHSHPDNAFRTSQTAHLCHLRSPVAQATEAKICKTMGIRAEYSEGTQAQRYDLGQQFKPHWDYFQPDSDVYRRLAGVRGNRTWTFMVYLNEDMDGGATRFTAIDFTVQPKTGTAVLWNNLLPDGSVNEATMHSGAPVTRGHKVIITKWFRVHGHGPLFYE